MSMQRYTIISNGKGWSIRTNGDVGGDYLTREAAFEAAVGDASVAMKTGDGVEIVVDDLHPRKTPQDLESA